MKKISLLNQKGGSGKTTLSLHLSQYLSAKNRVVLIDADKQQSATQWASMRAQKANFDVKNFPVDTLYRDIDKLASKYDFAIIDGPPVNDELARSIIVASDLALIPVQLSGLDVWSSMKTAELIARARQYKADIQAAFVINRRAPRAALNQAAIELINQIASSHDVMICENQVGQRVAYAESVSIASTVLENEPRGKASSEFRALAKEILGMIENG